MVVLTLITVGLLVLAGYVWWSVRAELADHPRRQADSRRLEFQAERRIQCLAYEALQQMLDEARRQGGAS